MNRRLVLALAAVWCLCLAACSTSSQQASGDKTSSAASSKQAAKSSTKAASDKPADTSEASEKEQKTEPAWPEPASEIVSVTEFSWTLDGSVRLGFDNGTIAVVAEDGQHAGVQPVGEAKAPIIAVSPAGRLAMVASDPGKLVRVADGEVVLRMNDVGTIDSARFTRDGKVFFVAEPSGKLHIWRKSDKLHTLPDERVQKFMDRQLPDFTAHFPSIRGSFAVTEQKNVVVGDADGNLLWWDPNTPNQVQMLVRMDAPVASLTVLGQKVAVTSQKGSLRLVDRPSQSFEPWSMKASAKHVAAAPEWSDKFAELTDGQLGLRKVSDGSYQWKQAVPEGSPCGLAVSADGQRIAACVDSVVAIYDEAGNLVTTTQNVGGQLR